MSSQVTGNINCSINFNLLNALALGTASFPLSLPAFLQASLVNGVGIGKANQLYASQISVAQGTPVTLDLYALGGGNDPVGNAYTMANIKMMAFQNLGVSGTPAETDTLTIGGTLSMLGLATLSAPIMAPCGA